jgi:hypothetical protein
MNEEFSQLDDDTKEAVLRLVQAARNEKGLHSELYGDGDVYAYQRNDGVAWGRNGASGFCTHRGVFTS